MRMDKYLKLTRLIKRRTVAKELIERGKFKLNGRVAKPSSEIKIGDELVLPLGRHLITIKVLSVLDYCKKEQSGSLYEIVSDEILENDQLESK